MLRPIALRCWIFLLASAPALLAAQGGSGQEAPPVFTVVEEMPEFPGGQQALNKYLVDHIIYPEIAREEGIQGKVILSFVVQEDGILREVQVRRGVHPSLDREAMRVVQSMPPWIPGKNRGRVCRVQYNLPVNFVLQ
ncbi:MAG: energy transducer TonB [Flavobacteriales bacterium]|nr:energy transducer TonB [Flavobacteriales bacterium]